MTRAKTRGAALSATRLTVRSLAYRWRSNLAILSGCVVGTSVLTGALLVGDSMKGSLRDWTLERLGRIDYALVGAHFFTQALADRAAESTASHRDPLERVAAAILSHGSIRNDSGALATDVQIVGTTSSFWRMFDDLADDPDALANQTVANDRLADELSLTIGANVVATVQVVSAIPREGLLGERDEDRSVRRLGLVVDRVIPTRGVGRFHLEATQRLPKTLFVPIAALAKAIGQPDRANALFISARSAEARRSAAVADRLLDSVMTLEDYGLSLRVSQPYRYVSVESRSQILSPRIAAAVDRAAGVMNAPTAPVMTYLVNTIAIGSREVPYSIVTALDTSASSPLGPLPTHPSTVELEPNEILINRWTADQLQAKLGDEVRLEYYVVGPTGSLVTASHRARLAGIVALEGSAADPGFTPEFPGITDVRHVGDWDPPFPIDLKRIRKSDEDYWDRLRTTPKAFLRLDDGQRLWGTRFGRLTSIRLPLPARKPESAIESAIDYLNPIGRILGHSTRPREFERRFEATLLDRLSPQDLGMTFLPVKEHDLAAGAGSTNFGELFFYFSFFLIVSAALLVGLLFRLGVERRAGEIGLLFAVGMSRRHVRRLLLVEAIVLVAAGATIGLPGAVLYAQTMIAALSGWWQSAVRAPFITFHATVPTLLMGWLGAVLLALSAIVWSLSRLSRTTIARLLAAGFTFAPALRRSSRKGISGVAVGCALSGIVLVASSRWLGEAAAFFGGGVLLLLAALAAFAARLRRPIPRPVRGRGPTALTRLAIRNAARYPARSLVTAALIAAAWFIVAAIGVLRHGDEDDSPRLDSGNGGFALIGRSAIPILADLNSPDDRDRLGISESTTPYFDEAKVFSFRVRPGDDVSCLNVYQPRNPTLLAADEAFIRRGGFTFGDHLGKTEGERSNPWTLLDRGLADGAVPAIGDGNALQWILKVGIGEDLVVENEFGEPITLRIVAALKGSIFQGELLVSETNLLKHFPSHVGRQFFLLEAPAGITSGGLSEVRRQLERDLGEFGLDLVTTAERLAEFRAVERTYMAAFQSLGGLGLVLGTLGLGTVVMRNALERRGELALLRALGFRKAALGWLVLAENAWLLVVGLAIGSVCAGVAVAPQLHDLPDAQPLASLAGLLLAVFGVGLVSGLFAVVNALRPPLITALRRE
jgi:ABC-type lipoprotein release transport system permease subunit